MLLERDAIIEALEILPVDDFYRGGHKQIAQAIYDLHTAGEPVDLITLGSILRDRRQLELIGGTLYLTTLMQQVPTAAGITHYCRLVHDAAVRRAMIHTVDGVLHQCYNDARDTELLVQDAVGQVMEVAERARSKDDIPIRSLHDWEMDVFWEMKREDTHGAVQGIRTGFPSLDLLVDPMLAGDFVVVAARPSMGKCLKKNAKIRMKDGAYKCVSDVRPGDLVACITNDLRVTAARCLASFTNGPKPLFTVTLRSGRRMTITDNHPLRTLDGWTELKALAAGSRVALLARDLHGDARTMMPERARLLGYLMADGGLTGTTPRYTKTHPGVVDDFRVCVAQGFTGAEVHKVSAHEPQYTITGTSGVRNPLTTWLREIGLMGKGSHDKFVPDEILRGDATVVANFLHGLITGDGSLYRNGATGWTFEYSSMSETLVRQVADLLLRFGVVGSVSSKTTNFQTTAWRVRVTDPMSIQRLLDEISIGGGKADGYDRLPTDALRSNIYNTPKEIWPYLRAKAKAAGITMETLVGHPLGGSTYRRDIGRDRLARYAEILNDDRLRALATAEVWWDTIDTIEPIGVEETWDLTIEGTHNFVSDAIVSHNSILAYQLCKHAARAAEPALFVSVEMGCKSLAKRGLAAESGVPSSEMKSIDRRTSNEELVYQPLMAAMDRDYGLPFYMVKPPSCTPNDVLRFARRIKQQTGKLSLIAVDYLQLLSSNDPTVTDGYARVTEISRNLKEIAGLMECPVLCVSQLSRAVEQRTIKRPMLSDLRECVSGETKVVHAETGQHLRVATLRPGTPILCANYRGVLSHGQVGDVWPTGVKPVYAVVTSEGQRIVASATHPLLGGDGWHPLYHYKVGDWLVVANYGRDGFPTGPLHHAAIVEITPLGMQPVYDLSVPEWGSFLADGIVVHNSGQIEQDADLCLFLYRPGYYTSNDWEENRKNNLQPGDVSSTEILIAKQRNGGAGISAWLTLQMELSRFDDINPHQMAAAY
jgi:replicative DNA helicase